jgi:polysaccharide biosynthesis protein PslG
MRSAGIGYGMNVWLPPAADADRTLTLLTGAGFNWARQWIAWESVEPAQGNFQWKILDDVVAAAERQKVKLNLILLRAPQWAAPRGGIPQDKQTFARYAGAVAARYKGRIAAYEIWNEQNMAGETGGTVNAAEYAALLKAAFPAIKAADPGAFVVYGGLTPTGVNNPSIAVDDAVYLRQSYAFNNGEIKQYFDVLGIHASGANNPPEAFWPESPGPGPGYFDHPSFYFRRAEDLRKVMEEAGDGQKQAWITEFGWTTKNQAKGYEYGEFISEQEQAEYLVNAFKWAQEKWAAWCGVMFLWNLNFSTVSPPSDEKYPWSIINADYSPRPAYTALKEMPKK